MKAMEMEGMEGAILIFMLGNMEQTVARKQTKREKNNAQNSCGGVANLMGDEYCQFCGNDPNKCESQAKLDADTKAKAESLSKPA